MPAESWSDDYVVVAVPNSMRLSFVYVSNTIHGSCFGGRSDFHVGVGLNVVHQLVASWVSNF